MGAKIIKDFEESDELDKQHEEWLNSVKIYDICEKFHGENETDFDYGK